MLLHFSILLSGFTIFSAGSLIFIYLFFLNDLQKSIHSKVACVVLLLGLSCLQWCHYLTLTSSFQALDNRFYLTSLMVVPAGFFYFSRFVLFPRLVPDYKDLAHLLPTLASLMLPKTTIPAIAFMIGSAYCLGFIYVVLKLRTQKNRFFLERFFFGLFALFAIIALILGLMLPTIQPNLFYMAYGNAIGIAMLLVTTAIIIFPDMINDIQQIAEIAYAKSTLKDINIKAKKAQLESLIQQENIYQNEKLSLSLMAEMLGISTHQLSELVNTQYGYGFSRFVRTRRIKQAKRILIDEPDISILAISIMTGFQSQSNFYSAFRESTSQSPGNYRKSKINT